MLKFIAATLLLASTAFASADAFKITTDKTVDNSSLETIVADVIRLANAKTNDEKGIALYNYLHQVQFHRAYPTEKGQSVGPLKVINAYGWGLCGGQHTLMKALFETAGWEVRYRGWEGHTTVETKYDGKWHYFDVFLKAYFWTKDKSTIASQDDINADPSIVLDGVKDGRIPKESFLACGDDAPGIVSGCKTSKPYPVSKPKDGWASVTGRDEGYNPLLNLRSGATLRLDWAAQPGMMVASGSDGKHSCPNMKDTRSNPIAGPILEHYGTRTYSNGTFTYAPDFSKAADVADIELKNAKADGGKLSAAGEASAVFKLNLPYPYATLKIDSTFDGAGKLSVSTDNGKTWKPIEKGDASALARQHYDVLLKAEFSGALTKLSAEGVIEHNRGALPYLLPGKNQITVSTKDNKLPPNTALAVSYTYQEATAPAKRNQYDGKNILYTDPKTVTKEVTALPFTFEIDVGGNTPPKMVSVERGIKGK